MHTATRHSPRSLKSVLVAGVAALALAAGLGVQAQQPGGDAVLKAEAERIAVVEKVAPAVVAIFAQGGQGGGSGVLITPDGYALTNYHVIAPTGPVMKCGLADGVLYDAVLVGQDRVGDVALIKLLPRDKGPGVTTGKPFPCAALGDSDAVREGDWSLAMGNPFLLATDFTPTVTFGMVSGVNRYQYPSGNKLLEYTNCIQIDTSINPGNSGGPLFNMKGELIGINGRGSFDKRGRINSGVGYAISINQIKNFYGHLKSGLDADHATLGALVRTTDSSADKLERLLVNSILEESDIFRRGVDLNDEIVSLNGQVLTNANHLKNVLGLYPRGWRVPLEYRPATAKIDDEGNGGRKEILVRLMGMLRKEIPLPGQKDGPKIGPPKKVADSPAKKFYKAKDGFANYYFNELERDRLLASFQKQGDFSGVAGNWKVKGNMRLLSTNATSPVEIEVNREKNPLTGTLAPVVRMKLGNTVVPDVLEPNKQNQKDEDFKVPRGSGGLLSALYVYQQLLTQGPKVFQEFTHGGHEPIYMPPVDRRQTFRWREVRKDAEVLKTTHGPFLTKWFFDQKTQQLLGFEVRLQDNEDPCEVYLTDYRAVNGRQLPHRIQVYYGNTHYGTITVSEYETKAAQ